MIEKEETALDVQPRHIAGISDLVGEALNPPTRRCCSKVGGRGSLLLEGAPLGWLSHHLPDQACRVHLRS